MRIIRLALIGATILGLTAVGAAPAHAADPLDEAKKVVTAQLDGRLATLRVLSGAVAQVQRLTAAHRSTLNSLISADKDGLTTLKAKVAGETTVAGVREDAATMINSYRIYLLVVPKVHLTSALDIEDAAIAQLRQAHDRLATAVTEAKQKGKDVGDADAKLADLAAQLTAAQNATSGKADALLVIQPGRDALAIRDGVRPVRESVRTARVDLRQAAADARAIRAILKTQGS
jgi:hypothetical protein